MVQAEIIGLTCRKLGLGFAVQELGQKQDMELIHPEEGTLTGSQREPTNSPDQPLADCAALFAWYFLVVHHRWMGQSTRGSQVEKPKQQGLCSFREESTSV